MCRYPPSGSLAFPTPRCPQTPPALRDPPFTLGSLADGLTLLGEDGNPSERPQCGVLGAAVRGLSGGPRAALARVARILWPLGGRRRSSGPGRPWPLVPAGEHFSSGI